MINIAGYGIHKLRRWLRLIGGVLGHAGKDPIAHILFLKHEHPERYQQAYKFLEQGLY